MLSRNKKIILGTIILLSLVAIILFPKEALAQAQERRIFGDIGSIKGLLADSGSISRRIWDLSMSVANYILVGALIAMAFGTTLRINTYTVRKLLPNIIIAFILANASLFIIRIGLDIADILTRTVIETAGSNIIDQYAKTFTDVSGGVIRQAQGGIDLIFRLVVNMLLILVYIVIHVMLFGVFLIRFYALQIYIGFAPLAFMGLALPSTRSLFEKWTGGFLSWLFLMPISVAFLWIGMMFLNLLGGGIVSFIIGIFFIVAAVFAPFQVKGVGANLMAQLGGVVRGLGTAAATRRVETGLATLAGQKGEKGLRGGVGTVADFALKTSKISDVVNQREAEKKRTKDLGRTQRVASLLGETRIARGAEERLIGQNKQELQNLAFKDINFKDKNQLLAATEIVKDQYWRQPEYNQALAKTIAADKVLQGRLGYKFKEGLSQEEIEVEIAKKLTDGSEQGIAIAAMSGAYNYETGQVTDEATLLRLQSLSSAKIEAGKPNEAPMIDNGIILKDEIDPTDPSKSTYKRTEAIVKVLENKPQQIAKSIIASGGIADKNTGELHPWVAKLAERGQVNDAVLKGLGDMGNDVAENIGKHIGKLQNHIKEATNERDSSGKIKTDPKTGSPVNSVITQKFDIDTPININDSKQERTLKLLKVASDPARGVSAMNQAMIPVPPVPEAALNQTQATEKLNKTLEELNKRMSVSNPRVERSISSGGLVERIQQSEGFGKAVGSGGVASNPDFKNELRFGQQQQPPKPEA